MSNEFNSLVENKVWSLVSLPQGKKTIGGRWHFQLTYGSDGEVTKHKAWFVAKGYSQVYGRDFEETYAPTVKLSSIRIVLALVAQFKMTAYHIDIKTAYLNAEIVEEMYLDQPRGFEKAEPSGKPS